MPLSVSRTGQMQRQSCIPVLAVLTNFYQRIPTMEHLTKESAEENKLSLNWSSPESSQTMLWFDTYVQLNILRAIQYALNKCHRLWQMLEYFH